MKKREIKENWKDELCEHLNDQHGLILVDTELEDIYSCIVHFDAELETKELNENKTI